MAAKSLLKLQRPIFRAIALAPQGLLILIFGLAILLPLPLLANTPLHHDEALYIYWAKLIVSGQDSMLNTVPVDKPPLFIYLVALFFKLLGDSEIVARLPSFIAHLTIVGLTAQFGEILYNKRIGLSAALLVAISPFSILFAPTALTDPVMVAFVMVAAWAAVQQHPVWAGVGLGLALATKQQGLFFLPLIVGLLVLAQISKTALETTLPANLSSDSKPGTGIKRFLFKRLSPFFLALTSVTLGPLIWDLNRAYRPGFWLQSSLSYGGLATALPHASARLLSFINLLKFVTASPGLNIIFVIGLPLLLLTIWRPVKWPETSPDQQKHHLADGLITGFCLLFVGLHALFTFQVWDRYLLGLVPFLGLLLARILYLPDGLFKAWPTSATISTFIVVILIISLMATPIRLAVNAAYPLGGDHGAFTGAAEVAAYLRGHAGANVTLYHRWLGAHWRSYLFTFPYDFRFWQSAPDLARQAAANAHGTQYIGFPAWQSTTPAQLALSDVNLALVPIFKTIRSDGAPAIFLYKIEYKIEPIP